MVVVVFVVVPSWDTLTTYFWDEAAGLYADEAAADFTQVCCLARVGCGKRGWATEFFVFLLFIHDELC